MNYYVVIPAHNEEAFLAASLGSVVKQSLLPKKVIVVNDNSMDGTQEIIQQFSARYPMIVGIQISSNSDHIPGAKVIHAFNQGLQKLDQTYDFIVKLDADVVLPENYFEKIAFIFSGHPQVGIAGGFIYEQTDRGEWKINHPMNKNHVRGAIKAYSKRCFEAIGGLKSAMGWDTADELLAQFYGFEIFTDDTLRVKHLRPVGKEYEKANLLQGEAMYTMRYGFWITAIASLKMAWKRKSLKVFLNNIVGFSKARTENKAYIVNTEQGAFIRKLRWKNIRSKLF